MGAGRLVVEPPGFEGADPATGPVGHLGRLAVRPQTRGTGLGVALVAAIEGRAVERGLRVVALSAQTHAIGFYERLGYTAHGAGVRRRRAAAPLDDQGRAAGRVAPARACPRH